MPELVAFDLPCDHDGCKHTVSFRSDRSKDWVDFWLDGDVRVDKPKG